MERINPLWSAERQQAYTEVALIFAAKSKNERLTAQRIIELLSQESRAWARTLPHGHDETFRTTFVERLHRDRIIAYDSATRKTSLGEWGNLLVTEYLEDMIDPS